MNDLWRWWPLALLFLVLSGCASQFPYTKENYHRVPPAAKRDIYQRVSSEITRHRQEAETLLAKGEYYQALTCFRQAAFYDEHPGLTRRIEKLEGKIIRESNQFYELGQNALSRDKLEALQAFNQAVRINPEHQLAFRARKRLLAMAPIQKHLARLEADLQQNWTRYTGQPEEIEAIAEQAETLLSYQWDNELGRKIKKQVEQDQADYVEMHLAKGREFYQAGEFQQAKFFAQKAKAVQSDNEEVNALLRKIQDRLDINYYLNLSRYRLQKKDFQKAAEYAQKALQIEADNQAAAAILKELRSTKLESSVEQIRNSLARKEYEKALNHLEQALQNGPLSLELSEIHSAFRGTINGEIPKMLAEGKKLFKQNKLEEANRVLVCVLSLDPDNAVAATYLKKIQSRLRTIESLR